MESAKDVHPLSAAIEVDIVDHDGNVLPVGTEGRIRTRGVFSAEGYVHGRLDQVEFSFRKVRVSAISTAQGQAKSTIQHTGARITIIQRSQISSNC